MNFPGALTQLGRYQLGRVLGRGAMGMVYEAQDPKLGRRVAIKTILKSHLLDDTVATEYSARFLREAQAVARLNHPHIVTVFDFGEEDEVAYIVMEFIEGRELAQHFESKQFFDRPTAVRMLCELLDALAYAHEHGIVHRDIKPANIMVDRQGRVKLTDFGVARLADSNADRTVPGTMVGTPNYMSPEQIQGQAVGSRADLFAAGVVLYQFLTHQRPFAGNGQWTVQRKILTEDPVPPSVANPEVPPVFDAIVRRALAKNPDQRYQSANEFAAQLRQAIALPLPAAAPAPRYVDPEATVIFAPAPPSRSNATQSLRPGTAVPQPNTSLLPIPMPTLVPRPAPAQPPHAAGATASASAGHPPPRPLPTPAARPGAAPRWPWIAGLLGLGTATAAVWLWRPAATPGPAAPSLRPASAAATLKPTPTAPAGPVAASAGPATPVAAQPVAASIGTVPAPSPGPAAAPPARAPAAHGPAPAPVTAKSEARPATAGYRSATAGRCAELLQRLQLGEDLSPENLAVFQKECKR
ncbi:serine/threonine-protein kinase [Aquabacterium sp.]|uniref:serine/threonine-protein kinase n=1 Tax=Aquabacterium sp. TaxID=1872578 RepID=UPI003783CEE2